MNINESFAKLAVSFTGIDGGNPNSSVWFSGIEWGGNAVPEISEPRFTFQNGDGQLIPCWNDEFRRTYPDYLQYQFDQKVAKVLFHLFGDQNGCENYRQYMEQFLYTPNGHSFKLNLYPLNAADTDGERWTNAYYELTGLPTKALYWSWCAENRFPFLSRLVSTYNPKVIIGIGTMSRRDYMLAFAAPSDIFSNNERIIIADSSLYVEHIQTNNSRTHLLIVPFFGRGKGCINSNKQLANLAQIIRGML